MRTGQPVTLVCPTCGGSFERHPCSMKRVKSPPVCSLKCRTNRTQEARKLREAEKLPPPVSGARWIPLARGKFVLVDEDMYDELNAYVWHHERGYAVRSEPGRKGGAAVKLHRVVVRATSRNEIVDHCNLNTLDCRRQNLRKTTSWHRSNAHRRKHVSSVRNLRSKYKGVCQPADYNKWIAMITINNKTIRLGTFVTEIEAARAYDAAAREHFGEYAVLNFPD